jgi:3-deoxy-7-phosphoheptulonate synthase
MVIVMKAQATEEDIRRVCEAIEQIGFRAHPLSGEGHTTVGITGNRGDAGRGDLETLPGVAEVRRVLKQYKLASRETKPDDTVVRFAGTDATIGGKDLAIVAGPCSVENREQAFELADQIAATGARFFRAAAFNPHASASRGLRVETLKILAEIRERFALLTIAEAVDSETLGLTAEWADIIQIGARNMQNFSLLRMAGRLRKPVLLERGLSATLDEFLMAAEYLMSEGNYQVVLCERGVRTFDSHAGNTLDLSVIPAVRQASHLPILVDPSHGTGRSDSVLPMARAAIACGANGVAVEVRSLPEKTPAGGPGSIDPEQFAQMMHELGQIAPVVGRTLPRETHGGAAAE